MFISRENESRQMLPTMDSATLLTLYGATGGIPLYLSQLDDQKNLKENILDELKYPAY